MGSTVVWALITVVCLSKLTAGLFYTNSKENDYPRIGKRLYPSGKGKLFREKDILVEDYDINDFSNVDTEDTDTWMSPEENDYKLNVEYKLHTKKHQQRNIDDVIFKFLDIDGK